MESTSYQLITNHILKKIIMKNSMLLLLLVFSAIGAFAQDLVKVEDNTATLIVEESNLIGHLNNFMAQVADLETDFTSVEILNSEGEYFLVSQGEKYRSTFALTPSDTGQGILKVAGLSCTTSCGAIPDVCMPNTTNNTCVPVCDSGTCVRTVSVDTNILDY